jgi:hypothetical protein
VDINDILRFFLKRERPLRAARRVPSRCCAVHAAAARAARPSSHLGQLTAGEAAGAHPFTCPAAAADLHEKHEQLPSSMLLLMVELENEGRAMTDKMLITVVGSAIAAGSARHAWQGL